MKSLHNKNLIKDNNKIRNCGSNIAKMTVLEYMYCEIFVWKTIQVNFYYCFIDCVKGIYEGIKLLMILLLNLLLITIYPITIPIQSHKQIKKAKEKINKSKKINNEMNERFRG